MKSLKLTQKAFKLIGIYLEDGKDQTVYFILNLIVQGSFIWVILLSIEYCYENTNQSAKFLFGVVQISGNTQALMPFMLLFLQRTEFTQLIDDICERVEKSK